jgi:hypothetical protein
MSFAPRMSVKDFDISFHSQTDMSGFEIWRERYGVQGQPKK